jgi:hypothetical protein
MISRTSQSWPDGVAIELDEVTPEPKRELCAEWREKSRMHWNYLTGSRGRSRGELKRHMIAWVRNNPDFEFRIRPFQAEAQ